MYHKILIAMSLVCIASWAETPEAFNAWVKQTVETVINVGNLYVEVDHNEASAQERIYNAGRSFKEGFLEALISLITDNSDEESPLALANELCQQGQSAQNLLTNYLDNQESRLWLLTQQDMPDFIPTRGERIQDNWLFLLSMPKFSDHIFYLVVPRDPAQKAYNYGFN